MRTLCLRNLRSRRLSALAALSLATLLFPPPVQAGRLQPIYVEKQVTNVYVTYDPETLDIDWDSQLERTAITRYEVGISRNKPNYVTELPEDAPLHIYKRKVVIEQAIVTAWPCSPVPAPPLPLIDIDHEEFNQAVGKRPGEYRQPISTVINMMPACLGGTPGPTTVNVSSCDSCN
jgi:hypothetical protein